MLQMHQTLSDVLWCGGVRFGIRVEGLVETKLASHNMDKRFSSQ